MYCAYLIFFYNFRELLKEILGDADTVIPDHLDQLTLWKIILNMVSENHIKSNYFRGNHVLVESRVEMTLVETTLVKTTLVEFTLKSVHFKNALARSSLLSKLWSFSI